MPLPVACMMQYLTAQVEKMRDEDYGSLMVVKAVKGRPTGGRTKSLSFNGTDYTFGPSNPGPAVDMWTAWAARRVNSVVPNGPVVLVPVPNSSAVQGTAANFRTAVLARQIAKAIGSRAIVATELWWDQVMPKASEKKGSREAYDLYPHLVANDSGVDGPRVLLDDVLTSGGHLQAAAARLRSMGREAVFAVCCGRTVHEQLDNPYAVPVEELFDYDPSNPFSAYGFFSETVR